MKCRARGCGGEISETHFLRTKMRGKKNKTFFSQPCLRCHRLHTEFGHVVTDSQGNKAFFRQRNQNMVVFLNNGGKRVYSC